MERQRQGVGELGGVGGVGEGAQEQRWARGPPSQKQGSAVGHIPSPARPSLTECGKVPGPRPCPVVGP